MSVSLEKTNMVIEQHILTLTTERQVAIPFCIALGERH
jgi:hypothetical protein